MSRTQTIVASLLFFAALFTIVAALQYWFIRHQIRQTVGSQLEYWADDLRMTLDRNDILDLAALRRAAPKASAFVILASDGTVIATHGFVRGSITYAALPAGLTYDQPVAVTLADGGYLGGVAVLELIERDAIGDDVAAAAIAREHGRGIEIVLRSGNDGRGLAQRGVQPGLEHRPQNLLANRVAVVSHDQAAPMAAGARHPRRASFT